MGEALGRSRLIGTVGSRDKARLIEANGAEHAVLYCEPDFITAVKAITPKDVDAVFDGVGKDTFVPSFDCVRPFGMLVNYGNASGHPPPIDLTRRIATRVQPPLCRSRRVSRRVR